MTVTNKCPSDEQLRLLAVGRLPDPPAGSLEQHLLDCPRCAEQTAQLQQSDTLIAAVRQAGRARPEPSADEQARLERLMSSLSGLRPADVDVTQISDACEAVVSTTSPSDDVTRELIATWRPAQSADELGRLGAYRILKVLGAGGMGAVFLAEDSQLHRKVALKMMRPRVAANPGAAERFVREARAAAALRHDHILTIYQVGEEAGVPFLAMEYLEGESLEDRLRRESPLPITAVLRIGREIAEGLAAAHAKGLIHRDIKPANVWLEEADGRAPRAMGLEASQAQTVAIPSLRPQLSPFDPVIPPAPRVKLLDFGLARSIEDDSQLTMSGMIIGTPSYMAPEQASGDVVDGRADLFSLGVILYRMVTGKLPFPGKNPMEILKKLVTVTPASPRSVNPAVPQDVSDLIDQLLAKEARSRPDSAVIVARKLAEIEQTSRRTGTLRR